MIFCYDNQSRFHITSINNMTFFNTFLFTLTTWYKNLIITVSCKIFYLFSHLKFVILNLSRIVYIYYYNRDLWKIFIKKSIANGFPYKLYSRKILHGSLYGRKYFNSSKMSGLQREINS